MKTHFTITLIITLGFLIIPTYSRAASPGDLIKLKNSATVYYLGMTHKRYIFPSEKVGVSWYPNAPRVTTVSQEELSLYPLGKVSVTYRPGAKMVKLTTDPKVYAVSSGRTLRWITTEKIAAKLYGADWTHQIDDLPDQFFGNYIVGEPITDAGDYNKELEKARSTIDIETLDNTIDQTSFEEFYNEAQARNRDAKRIADVKTIQTAIEMYYVDQDHYPTSLSIIDLGSENYNCLDESGFRAYPCPGDDLYLQHFNKSETADFNYQSTNEQNYSINFTLETIMLPYNGKNCVATPDGITCH